MDAEKWAKEHKADHLRTIGYVWICGDSCDCSQASVVEVYQNKPLHVGVVNILRWEGEFYTEGGVGADEELIAYYQSLPIEEREKITWQEGIDYQKEAQSGAERAKD